MRPEEKNERKNRYDPLYRVIDETKEMQLIESSFFDIFDRLKRINNLGIIPEVFEMAKYSKYEHSYGTIYQVNNLIEIAENVIDDKYQKPLKIAAHFLHLGHFPFTFSTERGILIASYIGEKQGKLTIKKAIDSKVEIAFKPVGKTKEELEKIKTDLYTLRNFKQIYRICSSAYLIKNWNKLNSRVFEKELSKDDLKIIIQDLLIKENDGYKYLDLCDRVDYVQRDALYFGAVKIDISPKHLYRKSSRYLPIAASDETRLIDANLAYLSNVYYRHKSVMYFTSLYEKIVAALILDNNFKFDYLEEMNDESFKQLICNNKKENDDAKLSKIWCKRAEDLFNKKIKFDFIFSVLEVQFEENKSIVEIEEELITENTEKDELLTYPYKKLILLSMDYSKSRMLLNPKMQYIDLHFFMNYETKNFTELLKIIERISHKTSEKNYKKISEGIGNCLCSTGKCRINNKPIINELSKQILDYEEKNNCKWEILDKFIKSLFDLEAFEEIRNDVQIYIMRDLYRRYSAELSDLPKDRVISFYSGIIATIFSLPVRLLQHSIFDPFFGQLNEILFSSIKSVKDEGQRGIIFEGICLIKEILDKSGTFSFIINGLVIVDPKKEQKAQDDHEYDILKFILNNQNEAELHIFACSISEEIRANNRQSISDFADDINSSFPKLIIKTWFMVPGNRKKEIWEPKYEETGRSYNAISK